MRELPRQFFHWHPDASLNFQMNRWWSWVGEARMAQEFAAVAGRIRSYADWKHEFVTLASAAESEGRILPAAYFWRSADFFMWPSDPDRAHARLRFLELIRGYHRLAPSSPLRVPYRDTDRPGAPQAWMSALEFAPRGPLLATVVFFGGFDSYVEELVPGLRILADAGCRVIAFEGPGQGSTLHDAGVPMTPDWDRPVKAVLDHFDVPSACAIGLSLGGCLVIRAAAREARIRQVVAYDVLTDFFEVNLRQAGPFLSGMVRALVRVGAAGLVDALVARAARRRPVVDWGIVQGNHVTGTSTPFAFLQQVRRYRTDDVSGALDQDVLLLAGAEDHFVPLKQLSTQMRTLTKARSVTARIFTAEESAASHCQVGNYPLAFDTIVDWLRSLRQRDDRRAAAMDLGGVPPPPFSDLAANAPT